MSKSDEFSKQQSSTPTNGDTPSTDKNSKDLSEMPSDPVGEQLSSLISTSLASGSPLPSRELEGERTLIITTVSKTTANNDQLKRMMERQTEVLEPLFPGAFIGYRVET